MFTNRFLMVERVMGDGIGQRRRSSSYFRKMQSVCVCVHYVYVLYVCTTKLVNTAIARVLASGVKVLTV